MSKMKKFFKSPILFLYDFCAKRLNKNKYENKITELTFNQKKIFKKIDNLSECIKKSNIELEKILNNMNINEDKKSTYFIEQFEKEYVILEIYNQLIHENSKRIEQIEYLLKKIENIINSRFPFSYNDIRFSLGEKVAFEGACFVKKNMQQKGIPLPWRTKEQLLRYSVSQINLEGLVLEFGVYKGYSISIISDTLKDKQIYGFDSFEGLPETWRPGFEKGVFALSHIPDLPSNVSLIKGLFQETLSQFLKDHHEPVSFLHIDCDLYSSAKFVLFSLKDRIIPGTIILFDEFYNYIGWEQGEYKAFLEFIKITKKSFSYIGYGQEQVAIIINNDIPQ